MSLAITHFAVGAACTAVLLTLLPQTPFQRSLVVLGGGWGMVPDAWRFLPASSGQYAHEFHDMPLANLFWFHNSLDRMDVADSEATGAVLLGAFLCVTVVAEYRDYSTPEPVREALPDGVYEESDD